MVYSDTCWLCEQPWTFHDDDLPPLLCDRCHGIYAEVKIVQEILEGDSELGGDEDERSAS